MANLYELYSKRTRYRVLRENVTNAINVLSRTNVNDGLSNVKYVLDNNYLVNDTACKGLDITKVKEQLSVDLNNLQVCLNSINSKIYSISKEIEEQEAANI